jgi:hypothetical protein
MAHLFSDSFDHYQTAHLLTKYSNKIGSPSIVGSGFASSNGLQVSGTQGVAAGIPLTTGQVIFGARFNFSALPVPIFSVSYLGLQATQLQFVVRAEENGSIGVYQVNVSTGSLIFLAASTPVLRLNGWFFIEAKAVAANSGSIEMRVSGVTVLTLFGDLQSQGLPGIGVVILGNTSGPHGSGSFVADDFYVFDTLGTNFNNFLGDRHAYALLPTGAGSSAAWTPVGAATNQEAVDDSPDVDDDATYNHTGSAGARDLFLVADLPAQASVVSMVVHNVVARKDEAGERHIKQSLRENSVTADGADISLSDNYKNYQHAFATAPDTTAWTPAKVNAAEIGYKLES